MACSILCAMKKIYIIKKNLKPSIKEESKNDPFCFKNVPFVTFKNQIIINISSSF